MLEYKVAGGKTEYRFSNCIDGFTMPVLIDAATPVWIEPTTDWKKMDGKTKITVDPNFYIGSKKM